MVETSTITEVGDAISKEIRILLSIKGRLPLIQNLSAELKELGEKGHTRVQNDAVLLAVRDSYDMLVIDLCSLRVRMLAADGLFFKFGKAPRLFRRFTAEDCVEPNGTACPESSAEGDDVVLHADAKEVSERWNTVFDRVFPSVGTRVREKHVERLRLRFKMETKLIKDDRDKVRAHRYERHADDAFFLPLEDVEAQIEVFECYLNDLLLLVTRCTHSMAPLIHSGTKRTAEDLADLILHGSINGAANKFGLVKDGGLKDPKWYWQYRKNYYE